MVCLPVRGENPRAFASVLLPVKADKLFYTTPICVDLASWEIFRAGVLW